MFSAFRYPNYRLYWAGMIATVTGSNIMLFAQLWLAYELTRSPLYLGFVGGATAVGSLGFTLFGGVVADRIDRRRLVMITQFSTGVLNLFLAILVVTGMVNIWHILIIAFLIGSVSAFDSPTRAAIVPHLLGDRKDLMSAIAMTSLIWQSMRIVGPVFAAFLLRLGGAELCFFFTAFAYIGMVLAIYKIKIPNNVGGPKLGLWNSLREGIDYVVKSPIFSTMVGITLLNSVFGMSYVYLMPVFASDILKVGPEGLGFLMSAIGVGSFTGVFTAASLGKLKRKGWLVLTCSFLFGVFLILFATSKIYSLSLVLLVFTAASSYIYMVTVQTMLQTLVADELRGRVMGIYSLVYSLQPLGSLLSGTIGEYSSVPLAITIGGSIVSAFALFVVIASSSVRKLRV
ncbi:MAG: MFS transporter [Dehalococcoidia bacterium]|nr:MFS transporter [Dehalococcoidia bacterium]